MLFIRFQALHEHLMFSCKLCQSTKLVAPIFVTFAEVADHLEASHNVKSADDQTVIFPMDLRRAKCRSCGQASFISLKVSAGLEWYHSRVSTVSTYQKSRHEGRGLSLRLSRPRAKVLFFTNWTQLDPQMMKKKSWMFSQIILLIWTVLNFVLVPSFFGL